MMQMLRAGLPSTQVLRSSSCLAFSKCFSTCCITASTTRGVPGYGRGVSPHVLRLSQNEFMRRGVNLGWGIHAREIWRGRVIGAVSCRAGEEVEDRVASFDGGGNGGNGERFPSERGRGGYNRGSTSGSEFAEGSFTSARGRGRGRGSGRGSGGYRDFSSSSGSEFAEERFTSGRGRGRGTGRGMESGRGRGRGGGRGGSTRGAFQPRSSNFARPERAESGEEKWQYMGGERQDRRQQVGGGGFERGESFLSGRGGRGGFSNRDSNSTSGSEFGEERSTSFSFRGRGGRGMGSGFRGRGGFKDTTNSGSGYTERSNTFRGRGRGTDRGSGRGGRGRGGSTRGAFQPRDSNFASPPLAESEGKWQRSETFSRSNGDREGENRFTTPVSEYTEERFTSGSGGYRNSSSGSGYGEERVTSFRGRGRGMSRGRGRGRGSTRGAFQPRANNSARPQRAEGEEKWQYMVRKKKTKMSPAQQLDDDDDDSDDDVDVDGDEDEVMYDDEEDMEGVVSEGDMEGVDPGEEMEAGEGKGEEWRRKKIGWLCKEIPGLRPSGIVTILNAQRNWIKGVDTKEIMETLIHRKEVLRAHRVLKWTMQQPWYENDFEFNTKMANMLGNNGKLTRTRDMFDTIIANGQPPDVSTYAILVKAYIADRESESLDEALAIYNQMEQLGGYEQPATLAYSLFHAFTDRHGGGHLRHLHQADALFESMKKKGASWMKHLAPDKWSAMYTALIHLHSVQGNGGRVEELLEDMKGAALKPHPDCYTAVIRVCSRDGNVEKAETTFQELIDAGHKPDWRAYVALLDTYGVAGLPDKAQTTFESMEAAGVHLNHNVFEALIEAFTKAGDIERALAALEKAESNFASSMQDLYNLLLDLYQSKEMFAEIENLVKRMKEKNCRPNHQSYNTLIDSYIKRGLLDRAEEVYDEMNDYRGIKPNTKTYGLMIEAFGKAERHEKVKEFHEQLKLRKLTLPDEAIPYVAEVVGEKVVAKEAKESIKPRKLVQEQREMLVGVLLAGARMASYDNDRTYEFLFQLDSGTQAGPVLINHLYDMFKDWAQQAPCVEVDDDLGQSNGQRTVIQFATVSHGSFRFYAHQYRPEGNPVIPRLIHRWLNPLSLAYWYMYGGSKCQESGGIILKTSQYSPKELTLVVKALKAKTIDCLVKKKKSGNEILFKDKSAMWLWKLMEPHILDELKDSLKPEERDIDVGTAANNGFESFGGDLDMHDQITDSGHVGTNGRSALNSIKTGGASSLDQSAEVDTEEDLTKLRQVVSEGERLI